MGRQTWTTDAQGTWLSQRKKNFVNAQANGTTRAFVNSTTEEFIEKWPVAAPTPAELLDAEGDVEAAKKAKLEKQRQKIEWWFRNRLRPNATGKNKAGSGSSLNLMQKKVQMMASYQSYLHLHSKAVMTQVGVAHAAYVASLAPGVKPTRHAWSFVQEVSKRLLAEAPESIKEEVEAYRQKRFKEQSPTPITFESLLTEGVEVAQEKVHTLQNSINLLARTALDALKAIETITGFKGTVFVGGPNPETGENVTLAVHNGATLQLGNLWPESCDDWTVIQASFDKFIARCFPPELLQQLESLFNGETPELPLNGASGTNTASSPATTSLPLPDGAPTAPTSPAATAANAPDGTTSDSESHPASATAPSPASQQSQRPTEDTELSRPKKSKAAQRAVTPQPSYDDIVRANHARNLRVWRAMDKYHIGVEEAKKMVEEDRDLNVPVEEPEWIGEGKDFLEGVSDEPWWRELIEQWIKFEASLGYPDGSNPRNWILAKGRPEEARNWINRARNYNKPPKIKSVVAFVANWRKWWTRIQPPCRQPDEDDAPWPLPRLLPDESGDWSLVRRGGCNGIFMVIMCLAWWLTAVRESDDKTDELCATVDDVKWVLSMITPCTIPTESAASTPQPGAISPSASLPPAAIDPPASGICTPLTITDSSAATDAPVSTVDSRITEDEDSPSSSSTELPPMAKNSPLVAVSLPEPTDSLTVSSNVLPVVPTPRDLGSGCGTSVAPTSEALPATTPAHAAHSSEAAPQAATVTRTPTPPGSTASNEGADAAVSLHAPAATATPGAPALSPISAVSETGIGSGHGAAALVLTAVTPDTEKHHSAPSVGDGGKDKTASSGATLVVDVDGPFMAATAEANEVVLKRPAAEPEEEPAAKKAKLSE